MNTNSFQNFSSVTESEYYVFFFLLVQSPCIPPNFGSDTFEPLLVSSDDNSSESSSVTKNTNIHTSSDKLLLSNPCLSRKNSSSSSSLSSSLQIPTVTMTNIDEKKTDSIITSTPTTTTTTTTKHYKQRRTSGKLLEQQNANDSGDDNQQQQQKSKTRHHHHHHYHHKKVRNPRILSPLEPKPSLTLPIQTTGLNLSSNSKSQDLMQSTKLNNSSTSSQMTPPFLLSNDNEFKKSASSHSLIPPLTTKINSSMSTTNSNKPVKYNSQQQQQQQQLQQQQQRNFPRSLSKSFSSSSSSSSPPPIWFNHPDDRSYRHTQRHNMAVSPLERDTTLKAQQQNSFSSSTISPIYSITNNLRPPIIIRRGPRSFGFTLRAVKVFHGNTDYYTTQHVVVAVEGPAEEAGLRPNDVITHVNERPVAGLIHPEVVKLILSGSPKLSIRAIPRSETQIRTGGRRRSPSKQKIRYQQQQQQYDNKKSQTNNTYHQPYCQKYRMNSLGASTNINSNTSNANNLNKKHPQNNSLFRRLSERKVARDMEAAAAAAAGVSLIIPTTLTTNTHTNNTLTTTNTSILSSSLPLLSFNQSTNDQNNDRSSTKTCKQVRPNILDSSEWPPLQAPLKPPTPTASEPDSPQPTLLPSIVKQKSQISVSPLAKCPPSSNSGLSIPNQPTHSSLCKTLSEPPILSRHASYVPYPSQSIPNEHNHTQNYFYAPMTTTHKKKVFYKKPVTISAPIDSSFIVENNFNPNLYYIDNVYHDQGTRSSSTESSTSSTSTLRHVDCYFYPGRYS
ncbi:unnamed protein product [Rotaria sordida]|uniref:PDZ domain-containing protein n=1 Tax=Rotaria sordida TaxID=392033 RepID=A0A816CEQ2_9BILA|nr:unnamed protein product [Rotaria sordida]CAF1620413.1 unnamed protein product [Rotaria sordida]